MGAGINVLLCCTCSGRLLRVRARPFMFLDMVVHYPVALLGTRIGYLCNEEWSRISDYCY